ncbi:MAG: FtsW/RodA/SpoVE family cell cycle protein, partial [Chloroflexi bacterium]|nr:FtsW/RodA/SpoVE family cell cycle protein [Chloroflexota bacterium]
ELGLFGCLFVLLLYGLLVWRALVISREAPDFFGAILAVGIGAWIAFEAGLNVAVITALVPFTGITLPFISFGGSSLVVVLTAVGLLMNISRRRPVRLIKISERELASADVDFSSAPGRARRKHAVRRIRRGER